MSALARLSLTLFCVALALAAGVSYYAWDWFHTAGQTAPTTLDIKPGSSTRKISTQLTAANLIEHPILFVGAVRLLDVGANLKAGEYAFTGNESPAELVHKLQAGAVTQYSVSLPEGWTAAMALQRLRQQPKLRWDLDDADVNTLFQKLQVSLPLVQWQRLAAASGIDDTKVERSAEGWIFPDTYQFLANSPASQVVAQGWDRMQAQLAKAWEQREPNLPYKNPYELLTMASIVEKETGRAADRGQIAQVFTSRLHLGMRLQTDPTVIYGLGERFDGDLRRIHLRTDGPFNSYTRHGLPPTPIALPGAAALAAAAHPATGEFLYFVARGDGTSQFSKTLKDHEKAVRKFQLKQ